MGPTENFPLVLQSSDWVVFNTHQQLELLRIPCGGWRRPFAFLCTSPTSLTFAYHQPRIGATHVHCRGPGRPPRLTLIPAAGGVQAPLAPSPAPATADPGSAPVAHPTACREKFVPAAQLSSKGDTTGGVVAQQGSNEDTASRQGPRNSTEDACGASEADGASAWGSGSRGGVGQGGEGEPVTSLHAVHHGREVLCCALLPSAQSQHTQRTDTTSHDSRSLHSHSSDSRSLVSQAPELARAGKEEEEDDEEEEKQDCSPLCVLTGSEDGTMRKLLYNPPTPSGTPLEAPSETPLTAPTDTPLEAASETPLDTPPEVPSDAPPETPSGTRPEAPSETPHTTTLSQLPYCSPALSAAQSTAGSITSSPARHGEGRSMGSSTTNEGQAGNDSRQQRKAMRESDRQQQQQGLYGADEVGLQAAGSAIKSIVAMPLGAGKHSRVRRIFRAYTGFDLYCMHISMS